VALERARHVALIREPGSERDARDGVRGIGQEAPGDLDAPAADELAQRAAHLVAEHSRQVPRMDADTS
jgi:hypothetical protein